MIGGNTASLDASTNPLESEEDSLRRLTKVALKGDKPKKFKLKKQKSGDSIMDPDEVIRRAMHGAMKVKP